MLRLGRVEVSPGAEDFVMAGRCWNRWFSVTGATLSLGLPPGVRGSRKCRCWLLLFQEHGQWVGCRAPCAGDGRGMVRHIGRRKHWSCSGDSHPGPTSAQPPLRDRCRDSLGNRLRCLGRRRSGTKHHRLGRGSEGKLRRQQQIARTAVLCSSSPYSLTRGVEARAEDSVGTELLLVRCRVAAGEA